MLSLSRWQAYDWAQRLALAMPVGCVLIGFWLGLAPAPCPQRLPVTWQMPPERFVPVYMLSMVSCHSTWTCLGSCPAWDWAQRLTLAKGGLRLG